LLRSRDSLDAGANACIHFLRRNAFAAIKRIDGGLDAATELVLGLGSADARSQLARLAAPFAHGFADDLAGRGVLAAVDRVANVGDDLLGQTDRDLVHVVQGAL